MNLVKYWEGGGESIDRKQAKISPNLIPTQKQLANLNWFRHCIQNYNCTVKLYRLTETSMIQCNRFETHILFNQNIKSLY